MGKPNELRGTVLSRYRSVSEFGRQLGWTRQKTHRIVEHQTEPSLKDLEKMSNLLNISLTEMAEYFLP